MTISIISNFINEKAESHTPPWLAAAMQSAAAKLKEESWLADAPRSAAAMQSAPGKLKEESGLPRLADTAKASETPMATEALLAAPDAPNAGGASSGSSAMEEINFKIVI